MAVTGERKRKLILVSLTCVLCIVIMLSGTFAWNSISQTALNEAMGGLKNPGGRLHDDFYGYNGNKDIYVENFMGANEGQSIIVRIRLREYMELGDGAGTERDKLNADRSVTPTILTKYDKDGDGTADENAEISDPSTWNIVTPGNNAHYNYWEWELGGQTIYMPTFNKNKDSKEAEINGTYEGTNSGDSIHYDDYRVYENGDVELGYEIYDADSNDEDEKNASIEGTNHITSAQVGHVAQPTLNAEVITMAEWENEKNKALGDYWIYDADGWAYWGNELEGGTATGLLLDKITLGNIEQLWYYGIYVECQMVTADEIADVDAAMSANPGKGFYHMHDSDAGTTCADCIGECPSDMARILLGKIADRIDYTSTEIEIDAAVNEAYEVYLATLKAEEELEQQLNRDEETLTDLEDSAETDVTEDNELNPDGETEEDLENEEPSDGTDEGSGENPENGQEPDDGETATPEDTNPENGTTGDNLNGDVTVGDGMGQDDTQTNPEDSENENSDNSAPEAGASTDTQEGTEDSGNDNPAPQEPGAEMTGIAEESEDITDFSNTSQLF